MPVTIIVHWWSVGCGRGFDLPVPAIYRNVCPTQRDDAAAVAMVAVQTSSGVTWPLGGLERPSTARLMASLSTSSYLLCSHSACENVQCSWNSTTPTSSRWSSLGNSVCRRRKIVTVLGESVSGSVSVSWNASLKRSSHRVCVSGSVPS